MKDKRGTRSAFLNVIRVVDELELLKRSKDKAVESYRFTRIVGSGKPICVRVDVLPDGSGVLIKTFLGKVRIWQRRKPSEFREQSFEGRSDLIRGVGS